MRPTLHFGGVYGDREDDKISDVITMNPMDSINMRKTTRNSKTKVKSDGDSHEADTEDGFDPTRKLYISHFTCNTSTLKTPLPMKHCRCFFHATNFAFRWCLWRHGRRPNIRCDNNESNEKHQYKKI